MSSDFTITALDQGFDPHADVYSQTVAQYDHYQLNEYDRNLRDPALQQGWKRHYKNMQKASLAFLWRATERFHPRNETVMGIVGPGFDPMVRDYGPALVEVGLSQLRAIILIDFSRLVNRSACQSLTSHIVDSDTVVDPNRIHQVQLDVTGGLSTVYRELLEDRLGSVDDEEGLSRVIEGMAKSDVVNELLGRLDHLQRRLGDLRKKSNGVHKGIREQLAGLFASEHSIRFTSRGEPVAVDLFSLNMILAGTGAAADDIFWDKYQSTCRTTDTGSKEGLSSPVENTKLERKKTIRNFHTVITKYNTEVAKGIIRMILDAHPNSRILAMTDTSTTYNPAVLGVSADDSKEPIANYPRIDLVRIANDIAPLGIDVTPATPKDWHWHDEPEHSHGVTAFIVEKVKAKPPVPHAFPSAQVGPEAPGGETPLGSF